MEHLLKGYDERINEAISHRLISRTEDDAVTTFSSERLLISLARLGIPLVETLSVLDQVGEQLSKHAKKHTDEVVTTWHLRQIVFQALHHLDPGKYDRSDIEKWGDAYARRFGNPKNRTSVIMEDGESEYLTFQFLTEQIVPEIVTEILDIQFDQLRVDLISNKDIQRIADEILSVVQYMNVYEIHYDTLYRMVSDIALNPPHPWVVKRAFDGVIIEYDLERATDHAINMVAAFDEGDLPSARHKCMECLEHSCSALLAYYGVFMGVKPFHNLMRTLKLPDTNPLLWKKLKIHQLEGDLSGLGYSLMEFQRSLSKTAKVTSAYNGEKLARLMNQVTQIYNLIFEVLEHRKRIQKQLFQIEQINELTSSDFLQTVSDVFASIPNFKLRTTIKEPEFSGYWFEHNIHSGGILHKLDPRLLVTALHHSEAVMSEQVNTVIDFFEKNRPLCNTVMIISNHGFEPEAETLALTATRPNDRNIILLTAQDLRELYYAKHRIRKLGELMMDFYDKL